MIHRLGDRRDCFVAQRDPWEVVRVIAEGRKRRELDPTVGFLKDCAADLEKDTETPGRARTDPGPTVVPTLMGWYHSIKSLPTKTLLKMMRMGQRIAMIVGRALS